MKPFTRFYFFLSIALYLLAIPFLLIFSLKSKYRRSIPARFFPLNVSSLTPGGIWFHACSVGETRALKPFVASLPREKVRISTITQTGQAVAKAYGVEHRYLPYECFLPRWITPQKMLIVLEAEFWYLLFAVARAKGAKVVLLNARISERSFPKYMKLRWFYSRLLRHTDKIFCQSAEDKARFEALGAEHIEVIGNIKLLQQIQTSSTYNRLSGITVIAASTHDGEEQMALNAFHTYRQHRPDARLVIVPRHPERFDAVWKLITQHVNHAECARWSAGGYEALRTHTVCLVDAMGELNNLYAIGDIVLLGGAFQPDIGGHNPLEPAHFGCRVITGKHYFNQRELMRYVDHVETIDPNDMADTLTRAEAIPPARINGAVDASAFTDYLKEHAL